MESLETVTVPAFTGTSKAPSDTIAYETLFTFIFLPLPPLATSVSVPSFGAVKDIAVPFPF